MSGVRVGESKLGTWREQGHYTLILDTFEIFHNKAFKNNISSGCISILLWMTTPALKIHLVFTCVGVAMQKVYCKNQTLCKCFGFLICKL